MSVLRLGIVALALIGIAMLFIVYFDAAGL